jgi:hypothetical protein
LFEFIQVYDVPEQQCRLGVNDVLDISWQYDQHTIGRICLEAGNTILFVFQPLSFMSWAIRLHSWFFAYASDVVLDTIPNQETEVIHYHLSQLRLFYLIFIFYWRNRCKTKDPRLGGPDPRLGGHDPRLRPSFSIKWAIKYLFKYTQRQGGPRYFQDHFENLHDQSVNWTSYVAYHDDMPWVYHLYYNLLVFKIN